MNRPVGQPEDRMQTLLMSKCMKKNDHASSVGSSRALCQPKGGQPLTQPVSAAETKNEIQFLDETRRDAATLKTCLKRAVNRKP